MACRPCRVLLLLSFVLNVGLAGVLIHQLRETVPVNELSADTQVAPAEIVLDGTYPLIRILDGDTISVLYQGKEERVRLIGINAPEPNIPSGPECYAQEATRHLQQLARTGLVRLSFDETQGTRDQFGRLLAYVAHPDGTDLNETMLRNGYAVEYTYNTPYARSDAYKAAQAEAMENQSGLWAEDACAPSGE